MNPVFSYLHYFFFTVYPYICMAVFLMGSLARFDRDQYTWKSDSSQMLRTGTLRWGSNLFHIGILFLFFGHLVGLLTPHWFYEGFISAAAKQRIAVGGYQRQRGVECLKRFGPFLALLVNVGDARPNGRRRRECITRGLKTPQRFLLVGILRDIERVAAERIIGVDEFGIRLTNAQEMLRLP